jgi:hypothetical protein
MVKKDAKKTIKPKVKKPLKPKKPTKKRLLAVSKARWQTRKVDVLVLGIILALLAGVAVA